ncbi:hypothetical protein HDU96_009821 [Phlyctochytrium bullatum]|nr:hypothetical protein HDU96_009821 [Phlyctochytrium bullatum]
MQQPIAIVVDPAAFAAATANAISPFLQASVQQQQGLPSPAGWAAAAALAVAGIGSGAPATGTCRRNHPMDSQNTPTSYPSLLTYAISLQFVRMWQLAWPPHGGVIAAWIVSLVDRDVATSALQSHLSAVAHMLDSLGLPQPDNYLRLLPSAGTAPRRGIIRADMIKRLSPASTTAQDYRLRVAILLGFHGLRTSEFTFKAEYDPTRHLARRHANVLDHSTVFSIPTSDPGGRVVTMAATNDELCPVAWYRRFLTAYPLPDTSPLLALYPVMYLEPWTQQKFSAALVNLCRQHGVLYP